MGNVVTVGISYLFVYAFYTSLLFPGANLPYTVFFALIPTIIVALVYYLFSVSMPRTGGDYVWVSRVMDPSIGFVTNFVMTFVLVSSAALATAWSVAYGLAPMLASLGTLYSNTGLINMASYVVTPTVSFVLTAILITIVTVPVLLGTGRVFQVLWGLFIVALLGDIVTVLAFLGAPQSVFAANFNSLSGMNYSQIISTAAIPSGFTWGMTFTGSIFVVANLVGFNVSVYYGGEIRQVKRSQLAALIGCPVILAMIYIAIYGSVYYSMGADFLNAISALAGSGNAAYTAPVAPVINYLVMFASPNPITVVLSGLALFVTGIATTTIMEFACVRNLFAWSFDRLLPTSLAKVDSRRHTPNRAIVTIWVCLIVCAATYFFTVFFQYYIYATLEAFIAYFVTSVAAIFFPFRRKDIFDASPTIVTRKIGGVPLISILGVLGALFTIFLSYSTLQPSVTPPLSGAYIQLLAYAVVPVTIVAGIVMYIVAYMYRKHQGLDFSLAFKEIPPT